MWRSNSIARQTDSCVSSKCRTEQTSLISMEGSSGWGQILHRGPQKRGAPWHNDGEDSSIPCHSASINPLTHQQPPLCCRVQWGCIQSTGAGGTQDGNYCCCREILQLPPQWTKSRGKKAIYYQRGQGI